MKKMRRLPGKNLIDLLKEEHSNVAVAYHYWANSTDRHGELMKTLTVESASHQTSGLRVWACYKPISIYL
jgi:hypothetical protein